MTPEHSQLAVGWLLSRIDPAGETAQANWQYLQAAHIVGQLQFALHGTVHLQMLRQAWQDGDFGEGLAQLLRLALVPLGHLTDRLPLGNSGRGDVSAFSPMRVKPAIAALVLQAQRHALKC